MRVRWSAAAKGAALAVVGLLALEVGPALLEPPAPPPPDADVGLPRISSPAAPRAGAARADSRHLAPKPAKARVPHRRARTRRKPPTARRRSAATRR
ncbi:MAG TPA: hypothetical protein VG518_10105, partial [Solirubrobacterales bacterium]|nr:hypothetical protein [Solirubrobacterales bacterium]